MCRRGDIYYVDFGINYDSYKQSGVRPAIIVSNNKANTNSPVVTVIPLTARTWKKKYLPTHILIPTRIHTGLGRASMALAEQVETLDKKFLGDKIGEVNDEMVMGQITVALQIQIGAYDEYN